MACGMLFVFMVERACSLGWINGRHVDPLVVNVSALFRVRLVGLITVRSS
jgi:hypothetical protein